MQQQPQSPTMFCHDSTTIFYPTAPGRVYMIAITALADCDGSDTDYADSTSCGNMSDVTDAAHHGNLLPVHDHVAPAAWATLIEVGGVNVKMGGAERLADFLDALEQWADYCDRDSARLDSFDSVLGAIERAA